MSDGEVMTSNWNKHASIPREFLECPSSGVMCTTFHLHWCIKLLLASELSHLQNKAQLLTCNYLLPFYASKWKERCFTCNDENVFPRLVHPCDEDVSSLLNGRNMPFFYPLMYHIDQTERKSQDTVLIHDNHHCSLVIHSRSLSKQQCPDCIPDVPLQHDQLGNG